MREAKIRLDYFWDDGDDIWENILIVPNNITNNQIEEIIIKEHKFLCFDDEDDIYGTQGRNAVTLLDYICKKYHWEWKDFEFDIDLNMS